VLQARQAMWFNFLLVSKGLKAFIKGSEPWAGEEQESWCSLAETLVSSVFTMAGAVEQIVTTYFRGLTPLFPATAEELGRLVEVTLHISERYHDSVEYGVLSVKSGRKGAKPPIDLNAVRKQAEASAKQRAQEIITLAQAEALSMTGEPTRGVDLVESRIL